jgi:anti-sigma B factor antagonist
MDSSGVGTMVEIKRLVERGGGRLVLAGLQPRVRSVFEVTQLDRFFDIAKDINDATHL